MGIYGFPKMEIVSLSHTEIVIPMTGSVNFFPVIYQYTSITNVSRLDFLPITQSYMNKLSNLQSKSARFEWSAFAGCFSQSQWQSVHAVWGLNGALMSLGMAVCGCTAPWC